MPWLKPDGEDSGPLYLIEAFSLLRFDHDSSRVSSLGWKWHSWWRKQAQMMIAIVCCVWGRRAWQPFESPWITVRYFLTQAESSFPVWCPRSYSVDAARWLIAVILMLAFPNSYKPTYSTSGLGQNQSSACTCVLHTTSRFEPDLLYSYKCVYTCSILHCVIMYVFTYYSLIWMYMCTYIYVFICIYVFRCI